MPTENLTQDHEFSAVKTASGSKPPSCAIQTLDSRRSSNHLQWPTRPRRLHHAQVDCRCSLRRASDGPDTVVAVAVVGVLALGIGATTAIFSLVNAVLLRPLPFDEPERLVRIYTKAPGGRLFELSPGKFYDWQRDARSFEGMAIYPCCGLRRFALTGRGAARTVSVTSASAGFFEIARARPALGRVFRPDEDTPGGKYVVVLSDRFWRSEFGGNTDAIGGTLKLNDEAYTIIGVMPASASVASWTAMASDVWVPLALNDRASRGNHNLDGVARLNRDVDLAQAQAEMDAISARLAREFPKSDERWRAVVIPMQEAIVGNSRTMLLMLLGAVGLVLLHRLRQRRQPAVHSGPEPAQGDRDSIGAWSGTLTRVSATAGRGPAARGRRWRARASARVRDPRLRLGAARQPAAEGGGNLDRCASAAVRGGGVDSHRHARRYAAGDTRGPVRPRRRPQRRRARRRFDRGRHAPAADRVRSRAAPWCC